LVFRTLEFLGGGKGIGAIYTDIIPENVLIDVSRTTADYVDAIAFASFLSKAMAKKS